MSATSARPTHIGTRDAVLRNLDAFIFVAFDAFVIWQRDSGVRLRAGMSIAAAGVALWITGRIQLGSSFIESAQGRRLATGGFYSKIRHPLYLFPALGYLGLRVALGNGVALALFAVLYSYQIPRNEEGRAHPGGDVWRSVSPLQGRDVVLSRPKI